MAGEHGWGYGGEPQNKIPAAPTELTEPMSDADVGEIAPPDPGGHQPDWRRQAVDAPVDASDSAPGCSGALRRAAGCPDPNWHPAAHHGRYVRRGTAT